MLRTHQLLKKNHGTTVICRHTSSQPPSDVRDWSCSQLWGWNKHHQRATPSIWNIPRLKAMIPKGCWVTSVKVQRSACWFCDYNSLFGMLCRWQKEFSNLCVCSCCADLRCCSGSMRYVNKLSYQGVSPITKKAVFQVGRLVVRQMH